MKTFYIKTLGCKVNQYEGQQIRELLQEFGLTRANSEKSADLVIVHTCCVTQSASSKSRQSIRKSLKINPKCRVIATGCLTSSPDGEINNIGTDTYIISRDKNLRSSLATIISEHITHPDDNRAQDNSYKLPNKPSNCSKIKDKKDSNNLKDTLNLNILNEYKGQTRAFLKVQDGCDSYCTYCIIPKTRKHLWSKPQNEVIKEAQNLIHAGHKEIVLTGIFLGAYEQNTCRKRKWESPLQTKLTELVNKIASIQGLSRLRLSSLEPGDVTEELLTVFQEHNNIMPHLHLPLQAGSDNILKKMNRQYNLTEYKEMIELVRSKLDRPAITTDIIVGFPGETDQDFEKTIETVKLAKFSKIHVFSFSKRKGTPAATMQNQVPANIIKERYNILSDIDIQAQAQFNSQFIGEKMDIIIENVKKQSGHTNRYLNLQIDSKVKYHKNDIVKGILQPDTTTLKVE